MATSDILPLSTCQTQKAKGILSIASQKNGPFVFGAVRKARVFPHQAIPDFPFFARPCPQVPRHGFVDSRPVQTTEEWNALVKEVKASGEKVWEIICMPFISADWSGIATPNGISIGPGHDGATSGKNSRAIPTSATLPQFYKYLLGMNQSEAETFAGVKTCPYVEFVHAKGKDLEAVQLRDGPSVTLGDTYCIKKTTIKQVIDARSVGEDLLKWEELMQQFDGKPGVVVWHPGGCLSSHFAVQAIVHGFPVVCTDVEPKVGATLEKSGNAAKPFSKKDYQLLAKYLAEAAQHVHPGESVRQEIDLAIAVLHGQAVWGPEPHLLILRAVAISYMMRFGMAAVLGELRHWDSHPGRLGVERRTKFNIRGKRQGKKPANPTLDQVYMNAYRLKSQELSTMIPTAILDFQQKGWGGAYGGANWANCTEGMCKLYQTVSSFLVAHTEENWKEVVTAWNTIINLFHNSGSFLNKFIDQQRMTLLNQVPMVGLINGLTGKLVAHADQYKVYHRTKGVARRLRPGTVVKKVQQFALPTQLEARMQWRKTGLYVQIALPFYNGKDYGMANHYQVPAASAVILQGMKLDGQSLSGTSTLYAKGTVERRNGHLILTVTQNGYQVALQADCFGDSYAKEVIEIEK